MADRSRVGETMRDGGWADAILGGLALALWMLAIAIAGALT